MNLSLKQRYQQGYTLIETLVASAIMMAAIGAAASLSLAMVTQEEIAERSVRAANYLENAATLYRMGYNSAAEVQAILPDDPIVNSLTLTPSVENVAGIGNVDIADIQITFNTTGAVNTISNTEAEWTGGDDTIRTQSVRIMRSTPN